MRTHNTIPSMPSGYQLDPCGDWISVIVPEETTNLITNPSCEIDTTGYAGLLGATVAASAEKQRYGGLSAKITPAANVASGARYQYSGATIGNPYTISVYIWGYPGLKYTLQFLDDMSLAILAQMKVTTIGQWQRLYATAKPILADVDFYVIKDNQANTTPFYIDGLQFEAKDHPTTYCDGDQEGFVPTRKDYYWIGAPHASQSGRIAQCRAGGREEKLSTYGFILTGIIGLGMAPTDHAFLPTGFQGGATYQRSVYGQRQFSLIGDIRGDMIDFATKEDGLMTALRQDIVTPSQPVMLKYQRMIDNKPVSEDAYIPCVNIPSIGDQFDNLYGESVELRFIQDRIPTIRGCGSVGALLNAAETVTCSYILERTPAGSWTGLSGGADDYIQKVAYGISGERYVVGGFTTFGGVAYNRIVKINIDGTLSALGTGADGPINDVAVDASGRVFVTGLFTTLGGGGAVNVGFYDGVNWNAIGTGLDASGYAITFDTDGYMIVAGAFTNADGVACNGIAKMTVGGSFAPFASGVSGGDVLDVAVRSDGYIFISGGFTTDVASSDTLDGVAYFAPNDTQWNAMGAGIPNHWGLRLAISENGDVYVVKSTPAIPDALGMVNKWNGVQWLDVSNSDDIFDNALSVSSIDIAPNGDFWIGGITVDKPHGLKIYNGSTYHNPDIVIPPTNISDTLPTSTAFGADGRITIAGGNVMGSGFVGDADAAALTTIYNPGNANTYPIISFISYEGYLLFLRNVTTGKEIFFDDLYLANYEHVYLYLSPTNVRFYSNLRPRLEQHINRGSQETEFYLQGRSSTNPTGENVIAMLIRNMGMVITPTIYFYPEYQSLASLNYRG